MDVLDYAQTPKTSNVKSSLAEAVYEFEQRAGGFLMNAGSIEEFDQRLAVAKDDIAAVSRNHLVSVDDPEVVLAKALRNAWIKRDQAEEERIARERKRAAREEAPEVKVAAEAPEAGTKCPECGAEDWKGAFVAPADYQCDMCEATFTAEELEAAQDEDDDYYSSKESIRKGAPFAGYDDFDDCVQQNSDKDDPQAYCGKIQHEVEGSHQAADEIELSEGDAVAAYLELKEALHDEQREQEGGFLGAQVQCPECGTLNRADTDLQEGADQCRECGDPLEDARVAANLKATWTVGKETFEQPVEENAKEQHEQFVQSTWPEAEDLTYEEYSEEEDSGE